MLGTAFILCLLSFIVLWCKGVSHLWEKATTNEKVSMAILVLMPLVSSILIFISIIKGR